MARISRPLARRRPVSRTSRGLHFVPSFHRDLALGVSTYALELMSEHRDLDALYVPIGQGSGICGCIAARDALGLKTEIVGVQAAGAPAYALSFQPAKLISTDNADTFADGMATRVPDQEALDVIARGACARDARPRRGDRRRDPRLLDGCAQSRRRRGRSRACRGDEGTVAPEGAKGRSRTCPAAISTSISFSARSPRRQTPPRPEGNRAPRAPSESRRSA